MGKNYNAEEVSENMVIIHVIILVGSVALIYWRYPKM